jgi:predicted esterase
MTSYSVETMTHGRVLVEDARDSDSSGLIVACHGYAQSAEMMLEEARRIPGVEQWRLASVQALHRFYARGQQIVVASWMTRQDRELAIADNIAYLDRAVEAAGGNEARAIVFLGFSQGAAMAYRAALCGRYRAAGVIALGGDIPEDVKTQTAVRWPPVLLGAGIRETWYTADKVAADEEFLASRGVAHQIVRFDGGHEWTDEFRLAVGRWLHAF